MRDTLPKTIKKYESGILNLDLNSRGGTHWTAYVKNNKYITYFDSFGNLPPPNELVTYFNSNGDVKIVYNYDQIQNFNSYKCGHHTLTFLYNQYKKNKPYS